MDFHNSIALRRPPVLPLVILEPISAPLPQALLEESVTNSLLSLLQLPVASESCLNIFLTMQRLAMATSTRWIKEVDRLTFSNMLYELEYTILSTIDYSLDLGTVDHETSYTMMQRNHSPESEASDNDYATLKSHEDAVAAAMVTEAVLTSAQVFICAAMRDIPPSARLYTILLRRLRSTIDRPGISAIKTWKQLKTLHILLWAVVVGACVAPPSSREWWIEQIVEVMRSACVHSLVELEGVLNGIAWTDYWFADALKGVWEQVDALPVRRAWGS